MNRKVNVNIIKFPAEKDGDTSAEEEWNKNDEKECDTHDEEECDTHDEEEFVETASEEFLQGSRTFPSVDFFPYEQDLTDAILIVEDRKIHVSKSVLIQASPVFKAMFTSEFKEKEASEIPLPEKNYETFALFLRCILPKEYIELDEVIIADVLPLAHEYDVSAIKEECQWWLLNDIHIRIIKKDNPNYASNVQENLEFFVKCMYYGSEYHLDLLYRTAFEQVVVHKASRYWNNKFYKMIAEKHKCELMEKRVKKLEDSVENLKYKTPKDACAKSKIQLINPSIRATEPTLKVDSKYFL